MWAVCAMHYSVWVLVLFAYSAGLFLPLLSPLDDLCLCSTVTQHLNSNSMLWYLYRGDNTFEWTVLQIFMVGVQHLPSENTADEVEGN